MNIDPRLMQQLIKLSTTQSFNLHASGNSQHQSSGFQELLNELISASQQAGHNPARIVRAQSPLASNRQASLHPYADWNPALSLSHKAEQILPLVQYKASRYHVDPALVMAVIESESSFNPNAVSKAGAKGLMQLMDATAAGLGVRNPFNPEQNVDGGVRYLASLLDKYDGNVQTALAAYNAGPGRIDRLDIHNDHELRSKYSLLPHETQRYVEKVLAAYERYK